MGMSKNAFVRSASRSKMVTVPFAGAAVVVGVVSSVALEQPANGSEAIARKKSETGREGKERIARMLSGHRERGNPAQDRLDGGARAWFRGPWTGQPARCS